MATNLVWDEVRANIDTFEQLAFELAFGVPKGQKWAEFTDKDGTLKGAVRIGSNVYTMPLPSLDTFKLIETYETDARSKDWAIKRLGWPYA